jgi:hypothetical protein
MVATASAYDFTAVIDGFLATRPIEGRNAATIISTVRSKASALLAHPDVRYMPAFKILDLLAALVNIGSTIGEASQLRPVEVEVLLRESLSDSSPLVRQFLLEAALERARYEPMMLDAPVTDSHTERQLILQKRWAAMRTAHLEKAKLPAPWMAIIDDAVAHALHADDFRRFRQGPLLQLCAEMLALARKLHHQHTSPETLIHELSPQGSLWRRYALKSARFNEKSMAMPSIAALTPHTHRLH